MRMEWKKYKIFKSFFLYLILWIITVRTRHKTPEYKGMPRKNWQVVLILSCCERLKHRCAFTQGRRTVEVFNAICIYTLHLAESEGVEELILEFQTFLAIFLLAQYQIPLFQMVFLTYCILSLMWSSWRF